MPEKSTSLFPWIFRSNPTMCHWRYGALITTLSLVIFILWSTDENTINNLVDWRYPRNSSSHPIFPTTLEPYLTSISVQSTPINVSDINEPPKPNLTSISVQSTPINVSDINEPPKPNLEWISSELDPNFTSNFLEQWSLPGGEQCRDSLTEQIEIPNLDNNNNKNSSFQVLQLPTGAIHEFFFHALDASNNARCSGGDYFETDLSGEKWKSRPPVQDFNNGTYSVKLQVHPDFEGDYNLTIILLFRHFQGLKFSSNRFAFDKQLRRIPIEFSKSNSNLPSLQTCTKSDFSKHIWSGRWTRHAKNDSCKIDNDGRYRCFGKKSKLSCNNQFCKGSLSSLESNGWVYSTHCSFNIFSVQSAWSCLNNRWIFFWGDSNHVDSIRNLLFFILKVPQSELHLVTRRFDLNFTNPKNPTQTVRITSIFNGHYDDTKNYLGLESLRNESFREKLKSYFSEETVPDTIIMNSGLHDGIYWKSIKRFIAGADYAASFWKEVLDGVRSRGLNPPELVYRTTVATGGYARTLSFNPNKMDVMNEVVLDKLRTAGIVSGVIDGFDLTYPWHYDNRANDGVHYGRAPAKMRWRDGEIGHQYFVDLMLVNVWLNFLCAG